ncbi:MAG: cation:proton antiporter [Acidaminococcales bacterium]|jgi:CPA2 family monovalent cation:H+ antiporter-2|nr:cation:proton antiporter [Acidaminococcales bacterium]
MTHLPNLISDLALILIVAGITTLIFKRLKQPLVLGYLVAGFLAGPHFDLILTVSDKENINTWAEIGIIFLLFALGLEFSIKKLTRVGHTAFITTITEVAAMMVIGYTCAQLMGWNSMDSIFLGGMLSMSSTTIIIKAFADLKLKGQKFTELVFGALIVEDIVGIVMMVLIATIAANNEISQWSLLQGVLRLAFFLILWFVLGIFIIPQFFRRVRKDLNNETLLIAALGMCLGMVVLANHIGFSSALGAFITGSILAETHEAERIEHLLLPVKDLFGAVFFVSVGMMVDPAQVALYAGPIFAVVIATIFGKAVFSALGLLLSGHSLKIAMQGGFSLAQIGEFSFIIAGLGQTLGVTSEFLYPIVVAVSVITTFTTPFCVSLAEPAYARVSKMLPAKIVDFLNRYTTDALANEKKNKTWQEFLRGYFSNLLIHFVILSAITFFAFSYSYIIASRAPGALGYVLETVLPLVIMSPFLKDLLFNKNSRPELVSTLWFQSKANRLPLLALYTLRILIAITFILVILFKFLPLPPLLLLGIACAVAWGIHSSDWLLGQYLRIEASFLINLNEKHLRAQKEAAAQDGGQNKNHWLDEELYVAFFKVPPASPCVGRQLKDLSLREKFGVNVLQVERKGKTADMPGGAFALRADDRLTVLGSKAQLAVFCSAKVKGAVEFEETGEQTVLKNFIINQKNGDDRLQLLYFAVIIDEKSFLLGKSIKDSNIRDKWHCLVLGLERGFYSTINPHVSLIFEKGDVLWVLGKSDMVAELAKTDLL